MRVPVAILGLVFAATPALADNPWPKPTIEQQEQQSAVQKPVQHQLRKEKPKTTVTPEAAPAMDPSAGSGGYGAPTAGSSNGNET
jgi:hypothetical protein